jgi:NarL family two-component system response regulator LiaR
MKQYRVLIVDDHPMFREAMRTAISLQDDFIVIGQIEDGERAISAAHELRPDVIVMDLNLPVKSGVQAIGEILKADPSARIIAITSSVNDELVIAAVQAGALGYVLKDASSDQFIMGLRVVASGKPYLPQDVVLKLMSGVRGHKTDTSLGVLTEREEDVLALVGKGFSNEQIARHLSVSPSTVRVHVFNILKKLNLEDRNQAIVYASQHARQS